MQHQLLALQLGQQPFQRPLPWLEQHLPLNGLDNQIQRIQLMRRKQ